MKKITFMIFAFLSMITIGFAQTETLAEWTPVTVTAADSFGQSPFAASTTADNLVVGGLTRGSGIGTTGTPAANAWGGTGFSATSAVEAVDENEFVTFAITADEGYTFSIESIEPYNIRRSNAGPNTGQWQYQLDGGTFVNIGSEITWGGTTTNAGNNQPAIDLSGIADLQDIDAGTTVTFRILLWGATGTTGTWYLNGHNNATNPTLTILGVVEEVDSPSGYCIPTATTNSPTNGIITNVTFNTIDNSTTDNDLAYQDYTSISTTVVQGESYDLSITTVAGSMMFATKSVAWIDWDGDNVFDSDEAYDLGQGSDFNPTTSFTIQIPADALGEYRLRVRTYSFNSMMFPFDFDACENLNQSEAEDYTIIVEESSGSTPANCDITINLTFPSYADVTTWELLDANGTAVLSGGPYSGPNPPAVTETYTAINPPYSLKITIDDDPWFGYCDNEVDYSVTAGGVQDIVGNVFACFEYVTETIPFINTLPACAPACPIPTGLGAVALSNSADLSWTSAGTLFDIEWGTTGFVQGSGTEINNIADTTHNLNGLTPQTSYDFYVRQNCGVDGVSTWTGPFSFTTLCLSTTVPYTQDFNTAVVPNMPSCTSIENAGTGNNWVTYDGSGYGFTGKHLRYSWNSSNDADSWFYTQGIELTAGTVYKVSYDYGGTGTTFPENLKVAYGTSPNHSSMTIVLADHPNVTNSTPLNNEVEFTPTTSGVYYFGFNVYSDADKFYLHLDNIIIDVAATPCVGVVIPTTITASSTEICEGASVELSVVTETGNTYSWSDGTSEVGTTASITVTPTTTTTYTVTVTNLDGCTASEDVAITVNAAPAEPTDLECYEEATFNPATCSWDITGTAPATPIADSPQTINAGQTLADIIVDGENLTWYSDPMLTTVVEESFEFTEGTYTFWVTQTIGDCESDAVEVVVEVTLNTDAFDNASFRTYPNPVTDVFNVSYSKEITSISVVNILGQTVIEKTVNATDTQIDMTLLPTGSYFVKVNVEGNSKKVKVIKQ